MLSVDNKPYTALALFEPAHQQPGAVKDQPLASYTTDRAARHLLRTSREMGLKWQDHNRDGVIDIAY